MYQPAWLLVAVALTLVIIARICVIIVFPKDSVRRRRDRRGTCHLAVFLGSGGHSSEALTLVSTLDFSRYTPRTYLVSEGDSLSAMKAIALERLKAATEPSPATPEDPIGEYRILTIPRARRVHQNLLTLPVTALRSLLVSFYYVTLAPRLLGDSFRVDVDVLLLNGPGTCFVLCVAAYINQFLGLPSPRLVYVETFARCSNALAYGQVTPSHCGQVGIVIILTTQILKLTCDMRFIVQWPDLLQDDGRGECHGWLV
ncbi:glycosyltransferase family 1 protein [Lactarius psammicola]|nr:glycosyltransferase family 1 protein [Lactarius psammicola]